jgi:nucleoside-diphosphate-sugar epimerase
MAIYLITGVAGFIGSNLARALTSRGGVVRGIDNLASGKRENLAGLTDLVFFEGDINDASLLHRAMVGVDYVMHHAAIASVQRSFEAPLETHRANLTGTLHVLEAARRAGVKQLVYAASSAAYGDTPVLPIVETTTPAPLSPYAAQKLGAEHYCRIYSREYGLPCVALRYFNVFGPQQDPNSLYAAVVPRFVRAMLNGESPEIFGDGRQTRDFTYIDNVVEANLKAISTPAAAGEVLNIACGEAIQLLTLVDEINRVLATSIKPRFSPARPGDIRDSRADITRARELLGYRGAVSVAQGLERAIGWYRQSFGRDRLA